VRYIQGTMGAKNPTLPRLGRKGWILGGCFLGKMSLCCGSGVLQAAMTVTCELRGNAECPTHGLTTHVSSRAHF
jgi:hypothetical protein